MVPAVQDGSDAVPVAPALVRDDSIDRCILLDHILTQALDQGTDQT